jgi:hypothetical protein
MNDETSSDAGLDPRARRARSLLYVLMALFVVAPIVIWFLVGRGTHK